MEFLHSRCPILNPVTTICDFEKAEHSAASLVFTKSTIKGCMFHFNQAQMRKFQKIPTLQVLLSSVYGLLFLPIGDVLDAWTELKTRIWILYPTPAITDYITYFEKTWIFSTSYPISMWNISSAVEYDEPRTNNASEGGNNALNRAFNASHTSMWIVDLHLNTPQVPCRGGDQVSTDVCWLSWQLLNLLPRDGEFGKRGSCTLLRATTLLTSLTF